MKLFSLIRFASIALVGGSLFAQSEPAPQGDAAVRDSLNVQKARNEHVAGRGKKAFYTRTFDLSDLPHYVPEGNVSGTIRMWGLNYIKDGNLTDYWEKGFAKFHPGVNFDYHLTTAYTAVSGLVAGLADIGPCRKLEFGETEEFERVFNYHPSEITFATGSYDVPGWNNSFGIFVNKANPIAKLTKKQLDRIFGAARDGGWVGTEWHPRIRPRSRRKHPHVGPVGPEGRMGGQADPRLRT